MKAALAPNEAERIAELHDYHVLDTDEETGFDYLVRLASHICGTPIALISLIDTQRQYFKFRLGFQGTETPGERAIST